MKFGLTQQQYDFILKNIVEPLSHSGIDVYVFGSRVKGNHQKFSDLDLLLKKID